LGRGKGTKTLYPTGTAAQLIALRRQLKKKRSLKEASWGLWWDGYPVSEEPIRNLFDQQLVFVEALRDHAKIQLDAGRVDEEHDLVAAFDDSGRARLSDALVAGLRRRTGRQDFPTFLNFAVRAAAGLPPKLTDDDDEIVTRGFRIEDSREVESVLRAIGAALDPRKLRKAFEAASMVDLAEARDQVRTVLDLLGTANALAAFATGVPLGPRLVSAFEQPRADEGCHVVLLWISLRSSPRVRRMYETVVSTLRTAAEGDATLAKSLKEESNG
jgi:hypothetical protein